VKRVLNSAEEFETPGDGKTWALYVACRSARHWTATKARAHAWRGFRR